jgi:hypothetical protein
LRLGCIPEHLRKLWASPLRRGPDDCGLFEVPLGSEEYQNVATIFRAAPKEAPAYRLGPQAAWEAVQILRLERIQNELQVSASAQPYCNAVTRSFENQGLHFEPGVHTCWAFHGADEHALESIATNPITGFQPCASGARNATIWGQGSYFARDAKYVAEGGFCGQPARDGSRQMLLCLLTLGMPCLGDPEHRGVLPFRQKPHRYNSSVDSLSSPEVYIIQHPGAAYPAYRITFV